MLNVHGLPLARNVCAPSARAATIAFIAVLKWPAGTASRYSASKALAKI